MKRYIPYLACIILACFAPAARASSSGDPKLDAALCDAATKGKPADIKLLVDQGANVNTICSSWQATPLENATRDDNFPNMTALLDAGADINAWGGGDCCLKTALAYAYSVPAVQWLLAHHANINIHSAKNGSTPLIWLSMGVCMASTDEAADAKTKIAQVMIDGGADVNSTDKDGMTPLIMAIGAHSKSFVALLLDHGAKVNARNNYGVSPMSESMGLESRAAVTSDDPQAYRDIQALLRAHGGVK